MFQNIGEIVLLFWRTLCALPFAWRQRQKVFDQFFEIGNASLLMVCVLSFFIGAVSCHQGLVTIGGPRGIGRSVTKAVVNSIVLIVIFDYILTRFLLK